MGWDEIDFNILKTGMITVGPATVSFADYLNVFSRALDERYNMTYLRLESTPFTLPNIEFEAGEIRNEDFWDKYKLLLQEYFSLYTGFDWYERDVLTDRANTPDYLIDDTMLIAEIGQDAFDALENADTYPRYKLFTADVLNALYIMYDYLSIKGSSRILRNDPDVPSNVFINSVVAYTQVIDIYTSAGGNGNGTTAAAALSDYNSDYSENLGGSASLTRFMWLPTLDSIFVSAADNGGTASYTYIVNNSINNVSVFYKAFDLDDNILEMDFYAGDCILRNNFKEVKETIGGGTTSEGPYNTDYPEVKNSTTQKISPDADVITETTYGTHKEYAVTGDPTDPQPALLPFPSSLQSREAEFEVLNPSKYIVDLNNSALEFYIAP